MLSPSDIRPAVREALLSTGNSLASYQLLDRLPEPLRDQIITERGMPGPGAGSRYTAASLVTDAVEGLLPSLDAPHRVYLGVSDMTFTVAGQTIRPGNNAIAFYRITAEVMPITTPDETPAPAAAPENEVSHPYRRYSCLPRCRFCRPKRPRLLGSIKMALCYYFLFCVGQLPCTASSKTA